MVLSSFHLFSISTGIIVWLLLVLCNVNSIVHAQEEQRQQLSTYPNNGFFGGSQQGELYDNRRAIGEGPLVSVDVWTNILPGDRSNGVERHQMTGMRFQYKSGLAIKVGLEIGNRDTFDVSGNSDGIERVDVLVGPENIIVSMRLYSKSGRTKWLGSSQGGRILTTGALPNNQVLIYTRGYVSYDGVDTKFYGIAFAAGPMPSFSSTVNTDDLDDEDAALLRTVIRPSLQFPPERVGWDDLRDLGTDPITQQSNIFKIEQVAVYVGTFHIRHTVIRGLKITYLLTDGGVREVSHGNTDCCPDDTLVLQPKEFLRRVGIAWGAVMDMIELETTTGRKFGPFGRRINAQQQLQSDGRIIKAFYGRNTRFIESLGVYFERGSVSRIVILGPPKLTPINTTIRDMTFRNPQSTLTVVNRGGTISQQSSFDFSDKVATSETFEVTSTSTSLVELSDTFSVGFSGSQVPFLNIGTSRTLTVGMSFAESIRKGETVSKERSFSFQTPVVAAPNTSVTATAFFHLGVYTFRWETPAEFTIVGRNEPLRRNVSGILRGTEVADGFVVFETTELEMPPS